MPKKISFPESKLTVTDEKIKAKPGLAAWHKKIEKRIKELEKPNVPDLKIRINT